jgi:hypothetical protein
MRQVEGRLIVFRAFRGLTVERNTEALRNKSKFIRNAIERSKLRAASRDALPF